MRPIVIDLEASGLESESYPIEVGVCFEDGSVYSSLIKREPGWTHWSNDSEKIHNISRQTLTEEGVHATTVANRLNEMLREKIVYSDAQSHDEFWIDVLFNTVGIKREFEIRSIQSRFISNNHSPYFYFYRKNLYRDTVQHRAGNDAKVIQEAYCISEKLILEMSK